MKKFTFALVSLLALTFTAKAQQYVSTEPANRNVILEEFTGRNCGYCPDGHLIANQIMANNPGRVWAINVHAGSYAPTTYPNFNTTASATILSGFSVSGFPSGVVNRSTSAAQGRGSWNSLSSQQLNQAAECNVAGIARINPDTRMATITVEVYYTGNSSVNENYLTVAMLQDSILGSQSGMNGNPAQVVGNQYCHMHILRDVITPVWGEAVSPTTQGTLITKTYEYQIPEIIGSPNGVNVVLDHIFFLAWVSEQYQGTPTRPILNACELEKTTMTDEPIYPSIVGVTQVVNATCSQTKDFEFELANIGTNSFTSIKYNVEVGSASQEYEWTGELVSGDKTKISFDMEVPFGTNAGTLNIFEINGEAYEYSAAFESQCDEWTELDEEGDVTSLKLYLIQDQWGEQITWDIINSAGETVASGGPYPHLVGAGATQINTENITDLPTNECYLFRIFDSNNNGICCNYGNGYYYIKDAQGVKFIESDGNYGAGETHQFSIHKYGDVVGETASSNINIYPNPANSKIYVDGENIGFVEVYNSLGQKVTKVEGSESTSVEMTAFENGVYVVRVITNDGSVTTQKVTIVH
ncbi:MAG: hypothetical protein CW336_03355 [Bacteroidetes bacterium]|nr:hypothetical protein [Bacteroidota bacterium]